MTVMSQALGAFALQALAFRANAQVSETLDGASSSGANALVAAGLLTNAVSRVGGGGTRAENGVAELLKLLSYSMPSSLNLTSADCGVFSNTRAGRMIAWLEEVNVKASNHTQALPTDIETDHTSSLPTDEEAMRRIENIKGRWGHGTFGMLQNLQGGGEDYLDGLIESEENRYFKSGFGHVIKHWKRSELLKFVDEFLVEESLVEKNVDKWGRALGKELKEWDGGAFGPQLEPELLWRAVNRGPRTLAQVMDRNNIAERFQVPANEIDDSRVVNLCEDLMKRYAAYKSAAVSLDLIANGHLAISGYSRDSLTGIMQLCRVRDVVNGYTTQHAQHTGEKGAFSVKKAFAWYGGIWRRGLEGGLACILSALLGMGPLASLTAARRVLTSSQSVYLIDVPCVDDSIQEVRIFSISQERDEWWAVVLMYPPWLTVLSLGISGLAELAAVSAVWVNIRDNHVAMGPGVDFVCNNQRSLQAVIAIVLGLSGLIPVVLWKQKTQVYHAIAPRVEEVTTGKPTTFEYFFLAITIALAAWNMWDGLQNRVSQVNLLTSLEALPLSSIHRVTTTEQITLEVTALMLWSAGEMLNVHYRRGRNLVTHEVVAFLLAAFSVFVGRSC
ncbi:hypothetical protein HDU93_002846 [Gonapodya sp. JEL0774]|nr:hypothetical protein HDU93_002846 [Gonapodya sp. JEL0774]